MTRSASLAIAAVAAVLSMEIVQAHSGPPYPIVSNRIVGGYNISIWSDPDATDDGTAGGSFWVVLESVTRGATVPAGTRATVSVRPLDREGPVHTGVTEPVDGSVERQFIALLMNHEGRFSVDVAVDGPLGRAEVSATVDATYDERPSPYLMAVYLFPFLAVGFLWVKVLRAKAKRATTRNSRA
jgi:nitrate reductase NapE component